MLHPEKPLEKAVFLDKDGTLVRDVPYNVDPKQVIFEKNVFRGLQRLQADGFKLVIVSNQAGLALGRFSQMQLEILITYMQGSFQENDLVLSGFYYCPHAPTDEDNACDCRKPAPGLITRAAGDLNIDLNKSWMIGDILNDIEAGNRAGCRTVLINNGNETEWFTGPFRNANYTTMDFLDAADYITSKTLTTNA